MNKAKEFYSKYIVNENHIIGGSVAIKKQVSNFREPTDLDIMVDKTLEEKLFNLLTDKTIERKQSDYSNGIWSFVFNDDSKIDIMKTDLKSHKTKIIDRITYLDIPEIIKYKIELIELSIKSKYFNEHNKHLQDLIFINKNYGNSN